MATLYIFSGLPLTGKNTLAQHLAQTIGAVYLRIDTIEQALRDLCQLNVQGEGYRLSYRIAADNLRLGNSVAADYCNPIELPPTEWQQVAMDNNAAFINIELICSDRQEHRHRIESRQTDIPGLKLPTWHKVETREYHSWSTDRITIDTAGRSKVDCLNTLMLALRRLSILGDTSKDVSSR